MDGRAKLVRYLEGLGVRFLWEAPQSSDRGEAYLRQWRVAGRLSMAPFRSGLAVGWRRFFIVADPETPWPALLHEAAHLLATRKRPADSDEYHFFAWELAVVRLLRLSVAEFLYENRDYQVDIEGYADRWPGLWRVTDRDRRRLFRGLKADAKRRGLLDERGRPVLVRRPQ